MHRGIASTNVTTRQISQKLKQVTGNISFLIIVRINFFPAYRVDAAIIITAAEITYMRPFMYDNRKTKPVQFTLGINIACYIYYSLLNHIKAGEEF